MSKTNHWWPDASLSDRVARLRSERILRCAEGLHDDPDNSGQCINCGAVLYESEEPMSEYTEALGAALSAAAGYPAARTASRCSMRSDTCPLCGEGWPEEHEWITNQMVDAAWERLQETGAPEGPTLLVVDKHDLRASIEAALTASPAR